MNIAIFALPSLVTLDGFEDFSRMGRDHILRTGIQRVAADRASLLSTLSQMNAKPTLPEHLDHWWDISKRLIVERKANGFLVRVYDTDEGFEADRRVHL